MHNKCVLISFNFQQNWEALKSFLEEKLQKLPQNSNLFQQQYITGVPSLKPPRRTCAAEQFLSSFPGCNLACGVSWLLYSSICMLLYKSQDTMTKNPSWNRFSIEGNYSCATITVQFPQRKASDKRGHLAGTCLDTLKSFSSVEIHLTKICQEASWTSQQKIASPQWCIPELKLLWPFTESFSTLFEVLLLVWKTI